MKDDLNLPDPAGVAFVEELYLAFLADPASTPYFERVRRLDEAGPCVRRGPAFRPRTLRSIPSIGRGPVPGHWVALR